MIPKTLLLGMLRPLLPKLERFLKSHENLKEGERAKIVMDIVDDKIDIQIIALKEMKKGTPRKNDEIICTQVLQQVDPQEL